ncbi:hypothetical protein ACFYNO_16910 [Kitasatospora sp. NPDC006697]|uniref:hypothetical protein n=1 Tax=Kitasatospora sp. NPDC006697 TaxID=3364020 RepID=UPI0036AE5ACA
MPLTQYVYFAISSEHTTAHEITALLGIEPDETSVRALFTPRPRRPTQPVHLIGCEPAAPLLALLCRPLPQQGERIALR